MSVELPEPPLEEGVRGPSCDGILQGTRARTDIITLFFVACKERLSVGFGWWQCVVQWK